MYFSFLAFYFIFNVRQIIETQIVNLSTVSDRPNPFFTDDNKEKKDSLRKCKTLSLIEQ